MHHPHSYSSWRGSTVATTLLETDDTVVLDIVRAELSGDRNDYDDLLARGLRLATHVALDSDATLARRISEGQRVNIILRRPRPRPPARPRNANEAVAIRPSIEELLAPVVFTVAPTSPLRPFQRFGVEWLAGRRVGILADDMGLGKTAQALVAVAKLIREGSIVGAVVVCPKSLVANWETESARWAPGLTVVRVAAGRRDADGIWRTIIGRAHIILTNYEHLRSAPEAFVSSSLELLIADEAHRLRRSQAKLVKVFRRIQAKRIWALTGTPIERHEEDLATLLSLLEPARFAPKSTAGEAGSLRSRAQPFLLRRLKKDVLAELPTIIDTTEVLELTTKQRDAYLAACTEGAGRGADNVLARITLMRSICDVDSRTGASSKLDRIVELLEAVRKAGEKAVIFSYLLPPLAHLAERLRRLRPSIRSVSLTGQMDPAERETALRSFKHDKKVVALLCSSRVGGEGLTLTEANHVVFVNEWWNPSANVQARDRVVRIGQNRIVHVHRFRCRNTIEDVLDQILERKADMFAGIVDALARGTELTESDSRELLQLVLKQQEGLSAQD